MNKQELIKKYEMKGEQLKEFPVVAIGDVLKNLRELDEPEKVTIPQFVADWIDVCKENLAIGLYTAMNPDFLEQWNKSDELISWSKKTSNQEIFARAWLDGYEVEEEKRYLVKMKGLVKKNSYLNFNLGGVWLFYNEDDFDGYRAHHTRKELEKAGFGWVFDCEGVEVEEVEERG